MRLRLLLLLLAAAVLPAADVTGKWKAEFSAGGETRVNLFDFKQQGEKLTGTVQGSAGEPAPIADGKLSSDQISFSAVRNIGGEEVKVSYKGKVAGNEIHLQVQFRDIEFDITAKRAP